MSSTVPPNLSLEKVRTTNYRQCVKDEGLSSEPTPPIGPSLLGDGDHLRDLSVGFCSDVSKAAKPEQNWRVLLDPHSEHTTFNSSLGKLELSIKIGGIGHLLSRLR
jgi:hypothetical protein